MQGAGEVFGTPGQQALQRRAGLLWRLLHDDPRYSNYGRSVALAEGTPGNVDDQIAVAGLLGVCACEAVPAADMPARRAAVEASGLATDSYVEWRGGAGAVAAARAVVARRKLPDDLTVHAVDAATPAEAMAALDAFTRTCAVLLPAGAFLRGAGRPAVCLYARDRQGRVVGSAAAVVPFHPRHPRGGSAWWGMLATDPARRGAGIALYLGARALVEMHDRHGIGEVFTGIREGNGASEALCTRLGLEATAFEILLAIDPEMLGAKRVTS